MSKASELLYSKFQSRINAGVKFLDGKLGRKKWLKDIDIQKLNLASDKTCIIGETMGGFTAGIDSLGISYDESKELGFYLSPGDRYPMLTAMWQATLYKLGAK